MHTAWTDCLGIRRLSNYTCPLLSVETQIVANVSYCTYSCTYFNRVQNKINNKLLIFCVKHHLGKAVSKQKFPTAKGGNSHQMACMPTPLGPCYLCSGICTAASWTCCPTFVCSMSQLLHWLIQPSHMSHWTAYNEPFLQLRYLLMFGLLNKTGVSQFL